MIEKSKDSNVFDAFVQGIVSSFSGVEVSSSPEVGGERDGGCGFTEPEHGVPSSVIQISAQFQNCSGVPSPSSGI